MFQRHLIIWCLAVYGLLVTGFAHAWKMEARTVSVDSTFTTGAYTSVTFNQPFTFTPVVFVMATTDGGDSSMTRIRNVTLTGFEVAPVEPASEDGPHVGMTVHYFAIEPGTNTLPSGHQITAGVFSYNGQSFNNTGPGGGLDRNDSTTLTTPGVTNAATLVQLQTMNNSPAHVPSGPLQPWMSAVVTSQASNQFNVSIDRSEDYDTTSGPNNYRVNDISNESLGYVYLPSNVQGSFTSTSNTSVLYETQNTPSKFIGYNDGCTTHNFLGSYSAPPLVIASKVTRNEADGGWLRRCSLSSSSVGLLVDEDQRQDNERSHIAEAASLLVFSSDFSYDSDYVPPTPANDLVVEAGSVTLNSIGNWQTVEFNQSYESTPAVFVLTDNANPDPQAFRIRNVTLDSFEVIALEPPGANNATVPDMEMHYVVFPVGQFEFPNGGPKLEVNLLDMANFQSKLLSGSSYLNLVFSRTDFASAPSVLVQVQSKVNGSSTSNTPWLTGFANNVTSTGAQISMDRAEVTGGTVSSNEQVAYLAIENGIIPDFKDLNGNVISGEVLRSSDSITHNCTSISFQQSYSGPPLVVGNKQKRDGVDGGWTRRCSVSNSAVQLKIDEDTDNDNDRAHTTEAVSFIAFSETFVADFSNRAYYRLDETAWSDTANEAVDSSNFNLHGTPQNGAATSPARGCYGANLNGASQIVNVPDDPLLDIEEELTVTAWVYPRAYPTGSGLKTIISKDDNFEFHLNSSGNLNWWWGGGARELTGSQTVPLNAWTHVAIVYSSSQPYQAIYINGVLDNSKTDNLGSLPLNNLPLQIGGDQGFGGRYFEGLIDEVRVYSRAISQAGIQDIMSYTHPCVSALDHIEIVASATNNSTCQPAEITLIACADNNSPCTRLSNYTGTFSLSTSTNRGTWDVKSGNAENPINDPTAGDGLASYTFSTGDGGDAVLELTYPFEEGVMLSAVDSEQGLTASSPLLNFSDNAFIVEWDDPLDSDGLDTTVAVAGRNHSLKVSYIKKDTSTDNCGVVTEYDGDKPLKAWYQQTSGTFDASVPAPLAPGLTQTGGNSLVSLPGAEPGANNYTVNFDQGVAELELTSSDVGRFTLLLEDNQTLTNGTGTPIAVTGESAIAVVRPFGFAVDVGGSCTDLAGGDRGNGTNTSVATSATDSVFKKAGEEFTLNVRAVIYQAGDADGSANPLTNANLLDNTCLPGFGKEVASNTVGLSLSGFQPSAGQVGDLSVTSITGFTAGEANQPLNYDEVGIIDVDLTQTSYLSSGHNIIGYVHNLGRFTPAYLAVSHAPTNLSLASPMLDPVPSQSCSFTYLDQGFSLSDDIELTVTGYALSGAVTQNYGGAYWRLAQPTTDKESVVDSVAASKSATLATSPSTISLTETSDYDGDGVLTFSGLELTYQRGADLDGPFAGEVDWSLTQAGLTDADGVCYQLSSTGPCIDYSIADINGTELRYGRVFIANNNGSELLPLQLPVSIQYWQEVGGGQFAFVTNTQDVCSPNDWSSSDLSLDQYTGNLSSGSPGDVSASLGTFNQGQGVILLSKPAQPNQGPGQGNEGSVNVTLDVADWLKFDFFIQMPTNIPNENPTGTATFGVFSGREPVFYLRESYR